MKKLLLILMACTLFVPAWATDSIKFNEVLRDVEVCYRDEAGEGERFCDVEKRTSGRFSARVRIPGLSAIIFNDDTRIVGSLGGLDFGGQFSDSASFGPNRVVFHVFDGFDTMGEWVFRRVGIVTMSRAGDTLAINASFNRLPNSIVAESVPSEENSMGDTAMHISADDTEGYSRTVYFQARASERNGRFEGSGRLRTINVKGQADFQPPTVKILSPRNRAIISDSTAIVEGTAKDNVGVGEVQVRVGEADWFTAELSDFAPFIQWGAVVPLAPGTNVVQVKSLDYDSQESKVATRVIIRPLVE